MKLLDYIRGLRKGKEAHRLEKESMKDPFLADAMDGYHQVEGNHEQQIEKLRRRMSTYSAKRRNTYAVACGIAACLVIGVGISGYFLYLKKDMPPKEEAASPIAQKSESDSVHETTKNETNRNDLVARGKQTSKPKNSPIATPPVAEEISATVEALEDKEEMNNATELTTRTDSKIKGIVTDEKGEPMFGANVAYKGTNIGTVTNLKGEFSLDKKKGDEDLTVSYIGYNTVDMPVDTFRAMLIAMNESSQSALDEVIITGYGAQKKSTLAGSVTITNPKDLKASSNISKHSPAPKPIIGMKRYKKYLKKNLIRPTDEACAKVKGKVVLTFLINKKGRPFHLKVKRSLCESADKEATRLILEGPDWIYSKESAEVLVKF